MIEHNFLLEITTIFFIASVLGIFLGKLKQPAIIAYILTGILLGPNVFQVVKSVEHINELAEIGVIALLFTLGLEFSFEKFKQVQNTALIIGSLQILVTIAIVYFLTHLLGFNNVQSLILGTVVALSSTVIVMKSLTETSQLDSLHGRIILGVLIIQDLSLIPIMILLPNLSSESSALFSTLIIAIFKASVFLLLALFISLRLAPQVMRFITSTNRELLILASVAIAIGTAIIATQFGISLELGAFIAGLALSTTCHSKQVVAEVIPFRDAFAMVFFVSIGLLLDIDFFLANWPLVLGIVLLIILIKFIICFTVVFINRYPGQTALWAGLSLFQIGEFSFVLAKVAQSSDLIAAETYDLIIVSALITMLMTPFVVKLTPKIIMSLQRNKYWRYYFKGKYRVKELDEKLRDHIIVCGYGPIGKSLSKILQLHNEKVVIIELNNKTVETLYQEGLPAIYGDATNPSILEHVGIESAKVLVATLPDTTSNEVTIQNAKKLNPGLFTIVRARYQSHVDTLYKAGADLVVYEEYETSLGIVANTLLELDYPHNHIESVVHLLRQDKFKLLQDSFKKKDFTIGRANILQNTEIDWIKVTSASPFKGKTIQESHFRQKTGTSVIAIVKGGENVPNPAPDTMIEENDILVVLGTTKQLKQIRTQFAS